MNIFKALLVLVAAVVAAMLITVYSGLIDVSATQGHGGAMHWLLTTTMHNSVERRAPSVVRPDNFDDEKVALAGAGDFNAMCSGCHGAPGQKPDAAGRGLNPPAPDLAESAASMSPEELYWVTSNGIKMTGMPAWSASHGEETLWPVVAFVTRLPELNERSYSTMLERGKGLGHHSASEGSAHSAEGDDHAGNGEQRDASDGHEHQHANGHDDTPTDSKQEQHDDGHGSHEH